MLEWVGVEILMFALFLGFLPRIKFSLAQGLLIVVLPVFIFGSALIASLVLSFINIWLAIKLCHPDPQ